MGCGSVRCGAPGCAAALDSSENWLGRCAGCTCFVCGGQEGLRRARRATVRRRRTRARPLELGHAWSCARVAVPVGGVLARKAVRGAGSRKGACGVAYMTRENGVFLTVYLEFGVTRRTSLCLYRVGEK
eukprot:2412484-Prymnesium_polylepis.1